MESYQKMKQRHQEVVNELPFIFAFSNSQLKEALDKRGMAIDDLKENKLVNYGAGCYCLKSDEAAIDKALTEMAAEKTEAMKGYDFAYGAFLYELGNHEYHINHYKGDCDVFQRFGHVEWGGEDAGADHYMAELCYTDDQKRAFFDARKEFFRQCDENGWW